MGKYLLKKFISAKADDAILYFNLFCKTTLLTKPDFSYILKPMYFPVN